MVQPDHERFLWILNLHPVSRDEVYLLLIELFELNRCRVTEGHQAAAALRFEHDIRLAADEYPVRHADKLNPAAMDGFFRFDRELSGGADFFAQEAGNVVEHACYPRGGLPPLNAIAGPGTSGAQPAAA
ncbi:MAG TPA: hypothetical protein PKD27_11610 [Tepidiformaceae bacterium]|nr:hypothetical protein [Tepidiformaceae bacterium]